MAGLADGFRTYLVERGYCPLWVQFHLGRFAQVSRWMEAEGLDVAGLAVKDMQRFLDERRQLGYVSRLSPGSLRPLVDYLRTLGLLSVAEDAEPTAADRLLEQFCRYLLEERGLTAGSVRLYARTARRFLAERSGPLADDLARLSGREINGFVLRESRRVRPRTAEMVVCALRALLRFLHLHGFTATPLADAVPSVAQRREDLPRGLPAQEVRLLLESCDRASALGRRDFAIVMLLARLGLRCGEVAALELDDLDWRAGEIVIHGKRSRIDRLPLPADVGEALADYLSAGRPLGFGRAVFLRAQAPVHALSIEGVTSVVFRASRRAGIAPVRAHRLRHTLATELLARGAGLPEIGQVLRHQSVNVTAIYAKVDRRSLSRLALPWPRSQS